MACYLDVELELTDNDVVKIYCVSLTDEWITYQKQAEFKSFHNNLVKSIDTDIFPEDKNIKQLQLYLNKVTSNGALLRSPILHKFLSIPQMFSDVLVYEPNRQPIGNLIYQGYMKKYPRYNNQGYKIINYGLH